MKAFTQGQQVLNEGINTARNLSSLANQPLQQGLQQPLQQGLQQPLQQGLQQPFQQGLQQQGFQQPLQQGFQQPLQQGFQQPLQQGFQQPLQQQGFQQPLQQQGFQQPFQQSYQQSQLSGTSGLSTGMAQPSAMSPTMGGQSSLGGTSSLSTGTTSFSGQTQLGGTSSLGTGLAQSSAPLGGAQGTGMSTGLSSGISSTAMETTQIQHIVAPVIMEHRDVAPVVLERIRKEEVEEVIPVIHREREKTEIHKVTQPIHTSQLLAVATEERDLPAQYSEMRTPGMLAPATIQPRREIIEGQRMHVEKPPVILETEKKRIIEEVTPVVYREIVEPHLIHYNQPIYEKIIEGDVYIQETRPAQIMNTEFATTATSVPVQQVQYVQQVQQVPVQIPVVQSGPLTKNVELAETFVSQTTVAPRRMGRI